MHQNSFVSTALTLVILVTLTSRVASKCQFPSFLQKDDAWVGDYKFGLLVAYVKGDRIDLTQSEEGGTSVRFTSECIQQEQGGKYLVRHKEGKEPARYRCTQFFQRGNRVVQIRSSDYSHDLSSEICADKKMLFDAYPWVQMRETTNGTTQCPFTGGYNMWVYYPPPNNSLVCSNSFLLMRMESECERGGGIIFDFRSEACVPKGLPRTPIQQAHCVTHWTQDDYTFTILQHATDDQQWWCLRTSDALSDMKSAYLWLEVICDMSVIPSPGVSTNYLRLNFQSRIFSSTCEDELEVCEETTHFCQINYKHHCAATCRECQSEKNIGMCAFDEQFRGVWIDSGKENDTLIEVDAYRVKGDALGVYSCLMLEKEIMPEKRVLLELYDNGCFPRYACMEMSKVNSSVMKFRLGHRHAWPLWGVGSIKKHICHAKNFLMHNEKRESSYKKERPPRLLINTNHIREIHCGLPKHLQNGIAFNENGRSCGVCLNFMPEHSPRMFTIMPINCTEEKSNPNAEPQVHAHNRPLHYSCLASFTFHNNSWAVVTKTTTYTSGMGQYMVWIFTPQDQIKVMKASETFLYEAKRHLTSRDILARFSILRNDKLKCRSYQDRPYYLDSLTTTTTTTTAPYYNNNHNNNNNHNQKGKLDKHGNRVTVKNRPDSGIKTGQTDDQTKIESVKTGPSISQNLKDQDGGSGTSSNHLIGSNLNFALMTAFTTLLISRISCLPNHPLNT